VQQIICKKLSGYIDLNSIVAARRLALDKARVPKILAKFGHIAVGILLLIPFLTTSSTCIATHATRSREKASRASKINKDVTHAHYLHDFSRIGQRGPTTEQHTASRG
jgi:hypothetical protein